MVKQITDKKVKGYTADEKAAAMVGLIGPLSTIGIALLVGFIALSVIMPMYMLTGAIGG